MKKISLLFLIAFGLFLVACEETIEPSIPQKNPQEPIMTEGDIESVGVGALASTETLNLNDYLEKNIPLVKLQKAENLPAGAKVAYVMQISNTQDFKKFESLDLTMSLSGEENTYYADAYVWNDAQIKLFGKTLKPVVTYYRVLVYINLENTNYRYLSPDYYALEGTIDVKRMLPDYVIEENYYAFGDFIGGNSPATAVPMTHDDRDVYDNPNFSFAFEVSEDEAGYGYTVMIAPQSVKDAGGSTDECYGFDPTTGSLILSGEPLVITEPGPYMLEVNMYDYTYTLKAAPKTLYVVYVGSGFTATNISQLGTDDYVTYTGMAGICNKWGLTGQASFRPTFYVNNPEFVRTSDDKEFPTYTGGFKQDTSGQPINPDNGIEIPNPSQSQGLFYLTADLATLTYTGYQCKTIGVTGTLNGLNWGAEPDIEFNTSYSSRFMVWTGTVTVKAGDEWKIRANNEWDVNFGGVTGDYATDGSNVELVMGGENFVAAEDATYNVTLTFRRGLDNDGNLTPYVMTVTKK